MRLDLRTAFVATILLGIPLSASAQYPGGYGGVGWGGWGSSTGSTVGGDMARGLGTYAAGVGQMNVNDAQARSMNADTVMRWNNAMWQSQVLVNHSFNMRLQERQRNLNKAQADIYKRLRDAPEEHDIEDGDALNVQLDLLLNPKIYKAVIQSIRTPISKAMIRDIPFEYASEGVVICINQLTLDESLPPELREDVYQAPLADFRKTMITALDEDIKGRLKPSTIKKAADSLAHLNATFERTVPNTSQDYYPTRDILKGLTGMVRMLHRPKVEEAIAALEKAPDTNLGELLGFMHAYGLRFGVAETDAQRQIYQEIYPLLAGAPRSLSGQSAADMTDVAAKTADSVGTPVTSGAKALGEAASGFFEKMDPKNFAAPK
jgi:hypothetical protein